MAFDFEAHVDKSGGPEACWKWLGSHTKGGYGSFKENGITFAAHREALIRSGVVIPPGKWALHNCPGGDNRWCVNPAHLYVGDVQANVRDMWERGHPVVPRLTGEKHPASKLTEENVIEMRNRVLRGESLVAVSADFSVTPETAHQAVFGKTWKNVSGSLLPRPSKTRRKLTSEDVESIRALAEDGKLTQKQIASLYGICKSNVSMILSGRTWAGKDL